MVAPTITSRFTVAPFPGRPRRPRRTAPPACRQSLRRPQPGCQYHARGNRRHLTSSVAPRRVCCRRDRAHRRLLGRVAGPHGEPLAIECTLVIWTDGSVTIDVGDGTLRPLGAV